MLTVKARVLEVQEIQENIYLLKADCPEIAQSIKPGQFCNIKVSESYFPLLRRPFSICDIEGDEIHFLFNVHGEGTKILADKQADDQIDILAPLGNGFDYEGNYETAVIVAGGLGAAPFPYLTKCLPVKIKIYSFVGGKSSTDVITYGMKNILISTDDGTSGFRGTVIDLLRNQKEIFKASKCRIYACGPTPMLRALKEFCVEENLVCQASTECAMACGFGICQGCPIESADGDKYYLVCKDGPVFDIKDIIL